MAKYQKLGADIEQIDCNKHSTSARRRAKSRSKTPRKRAKGTKGKRSSSKNSKKGMKVEVGKTSFKKPETSRKSVKKVTKRAKKVKKEQEFSSNQRKVVNFVDDQPPKILTPPPFKHSTFGFESLETDPQLESNNYESTDNRQLMEKKLATMFESEENTHKEKLTIHEK
jgi:hypothetical protein